MLQSASHSGVPQPRVCTLLRWVDGRFVREPKARHLHSVGQLTAKLHAHARLHAPADGWGRQRMCADIHLSAESPWGDPLATPDLTDESRDLLTRGIAHIQDVLGGTNSADLWLIHADLHQGNYVFAGGTARPIDFDDCMVSLPGYDLAVTLFSTLRSGDYAAHRDALLAGYARYAPALPHIRERLPTLILLRQLTLMAWGATRADHPELYAHIAPTRDAALQLTRDVLDGRPPRRRT